jgi:hypothetical protein
MPNILDDLFSWAELQPAGNVMTVQVAMATNEMTNNLVSYARGTLTYVPAKPSPTSQRNLFHTASNSFSMIGRGRRLEGTIRSIRTRPIN